MKHILTSVVFVVLLFPALALGEEVTFADLVERDGLYYKKVTEVPFTGKVTGLQQGRFKNGVMEGPWVSYHENGQLLSEGAFKNGKTEGPWVFYHNNGQLEMKGDFKNGDREGLWIDYYDNGQLNNKGNYKNGVKVD